jgi:PAS domain S-box-containing protein
LTSSLRVLLLSLTTAAIAFIMLGSLAISVKMRTDAAAVRLTEQTDRLLGASKPLLLNALVVEDLASAEQMLRNLNVDRVWRRVRLYEPDGQTLIVDASPPATTAARVPEWFQGLLGLDFGEAKIEISVPPTVYAVLTVTPSAEAIADELWAEIRTMVVAAVVLLATLIVLVHVILTYGLRPVRSLGESAARLGNGDLTVRMPDTRLAEVAPTVRAFNAMAENLEKLLAELRAKETANRRLAAGIEHAEEAILTVDLERRVTSWNLGARHLFDRSAEEIVGRPLAELFEGALIDTDIEARRLIETRPPARMEFALPRAGAARVAAASSSLLHDEDGSSTGYLIVARDITTRKATEAALREAKEAAESANRAKAEFLAAMSHEIRTPMNGIMGMTEILLDSELTHEQRECASLVKVSAEALLQIINDILDFSKIEAGRIDLEAIPFDLRSAVGQALKPLALQAYSKGLELVYAVHPAVPDQVVGDPGRLRQVLVNLVGNAVKFTDGGEVVVRIEPGTVSDATIELRFVVRDTGIGVPRAKQDLIFEAFTQGDGSMTRRYGGTGLGLPISKRLVELMHGRIWLESEEGRGSLFHFTARFGVAASSGTEASPESVSLDGLEVLVVDDNATSRHTLAEMLAAWRLAPMTAESGVAAWAMLAQAKAAGRLPALVITDQEMPGLDGIGLASRIRADSVLARIPVVMLSSSVQPHDLTIARQAGIRAYRTKPVTGSELLDAIMAVLGPVRPTPSQTAFVAERPSGRGLRVLLAEDNAVNQRVARGLLERRGHSVAVVSTGLAAVAALDTEPFDLVLMDIELPALDGFEATAAIRAREREIRAGTRTATPGSAYAMRRAGNRGVPIIALTAHALRGIEQRCLDAGMDGYLAKPVQPETLATTLALFVGQEVTDDSVCSTVVADTGKCAPRRRRGSQING